MSPNRKCWLANPPQLGPLILLDEGDDDMPGNSSAVAHPAWSNRKAEVVQPTESKLAQTGNLSDLSTTIEFQVPLEFVQ